MSHQVSLRVLYNIQTNTNLTKTVGKNGYTIKKKNMNDNSTKLLQIATGRVHKVHLFYITFNTCHENT